MVLRAQIACDVVVASSVDRTFYIKSEDTSELVRWIRCLRGVRAYSGREDVQALQSTLMSGWMIKKGKGGLVSGLGVGGKISMLGKLDRGGDKKRWVVLKGNGELIYYKDNKSNHPSNRFFLERNCVTPVAAGVRPPTPTPPPSRHPAGEDLRLELC